MAIIHPDFDHENFAKWKATRPPVIQKMIESHPPDRLYRLDSTGHRVTLHSYSEGGTVTVNVLGKYNLLTMERRVFGIRIEELSECDLPAEGEPLGALYTTDDEIQDFLQRVRDGAEGINLPV